MIEIEKYIKGGKLKNREAFYYTISGELAVEKDHSYLAEPTQQEKEEIENKRFGMEKEGI